MHLSKFEKVREMVNPYENSGNMWIAFETARTWCMMIMKNEQPPTEYDCIKCYKHKVE